MEIFQDISFQEHLCRFIKHLQRFRLVTTQRKRSTYLEAAFQWCSVKKLLLKYSQISQADTCVNLFFKKVAGAMPVALLKTRL